MVHLEIYSLYGLMYRRGYDDTAAARRAYAILKRRYGERTSGKILTTKGRVMMEINPDANKWEEVK